jgi:HK97 family phage prohead protease/HK97 family phage major capsid protein
MSNKEVKVTSLFTVKASDSDDDVIVIEGVANSTSKDRGGDVIKEEAWGKGGLDNFKANPVLLAFHDHRQPIGNVTELSVTEKGLSVVAEVMNTSDNVFKMIKKGVLKAFSVGFIIKDAEYDSEKDIFFIKDLELLELSVVSVGMNQDSLFSIRKSFESDEEYEAFKKLFIKADDSLEPEAKAEETKEQIQKLKEDLTTNIVQGVAAALENSKEEKETMTTAEEKAAAEAAANKAAEEKAAKEAAEAATGGASRVEKLLADLEARALKIEQEELAKKAAEEAKEKAAAEAAIKAYEEMKAELDEKAAEIKALQEAKNLWEGSKGAEKITANEIDTAVMVAKMMGVPLQSTQYFQGLSEKVGAHLASMTEDWESEFSTRVWDDIRNKLVMEPMFEVIQMNTPTLHLPINPEAGVAEWIGSAAFRSTAGSSTGTAADHLLADETMVAYKLAAKEYLGYEEEEDSIIPLVGIVQSAVARRMARSSDIALLRGQASGVTDPITGLTKHAVDGTAELGAADQPSIGASDMVTVAMLQKVRRLLGDWGTDPADVIYVIHQDAYYDLLEDPDFRTIDMVGPSNATILKGQIGFANGSPLVVSNEFSAKGAAAPFALAVNTSNFKVGNLRTLMVERDKNIEDQKNILVASRRMAFKQIIASKAVASGSWKA